MAKEEVRRGRPGATAGVSRRPRAIQAALGPRKASRGASPRRTGHARRRCPDTHDRRARPDRERASPRLDEGEREDGMRRTIAVVVAVIAALTMILTGCGGGSSTN